MAVKQRPSMVVITDRRDLRVEAYRSLKGKELEKDGIFIAEGEKVVRSMVDSRCHIVSCLTSEGSVKKYRSILASMAKRKAVIYVMSDELIEEIVGFRFHKGIMAVGHCPKKLPISGFFSNTKNPILLVALDGVNDPQNVGLITRNAAAFGADGLIVDSATYDPYYRKAVRVSMGTVFKLPIFYEDELAAGLALLRKRRGTRIIAATPGNGARDINRTDLAGNVCFVFGNEDKGVSRKVLKIADARTRIPISSKVDSLNVASASAVFLYEASRSRKRIA